MGMVVVILQPGRVAAVVTAGFYIIVLAIRVDDTCRANITIAKVRKNVPRGTMQ